MGKGDVSSVIDAIIAKRDAEIAALKRRVNEADQIVRAGEAERKALRQQVAELEAWKAAVPVDAIRRLHRYSAYMVNAARVGGYSPDKWESDHVAASNWLLAVKPD